MASVKKKTSFDLPDMSYSNSSVLIRAILSEDLRLVRFLLKKGIDPNKSAGERKIRPIMVACHTKNKATRLAIFKSLFKYRVNPELIDVYGQNGLMYTCAMKLKDELEVVLDHFVCSFYIADIHGNTLIHVCAQYGNAEVMGIVLNKMRQYSMNVNVRNKLDHTPLDEALLKQNIPCANQLVKFGYGSTFQINNGFRCEVVGKNRSGRETVPSEKSVSILTKGTGKVSGNKALTCQAETKSTPKESEKIVCQLLDLKSQRGTTVPPTSYRVPLDSKWVATTQAHLQAIVESQKWARQNAAFFPGTSSNLLSIPSIKRMQARTPKKLWRKALIATTIGRNLKGRPRNKRVWV